MPSVTYCLLKGNEPVLLMIRFHHAYKTSPPSCLTTLVTYELAPPGWQKLTARIRLVPPFRFHSTSTSENEKYQRNESEYDPIVWFLINTLGPIPPFIRRGGRFMDDPNAGCIRPSVVNSSHDNAIQCTQCQERSSVAVAHPRHQTEPRRKYLL